MPGACGESWAPIGMDMELSTSHVNNNSETFPKPLGLKLEISNSIPLDEVDSYYGRKQALVIPNTCRTVSDVKSYVKSIITLPSNIHLFVGEFCLRDDQDSSALFCFGDHNHIRIEEADTNRPLPLTPYKSVSASSSASPFAITNGERKSRKRKKQYVSDSMDLGNEAEVHSPSTNPNSKSKVTFCSPINDSTKNSMRSSTSPQDVKSKNGNDEEDSKAKNLTKSAKRRLRKLRLQRLRQEQEASEVKRVKKEKRNNRQSDPSASPDIQVTPPKAEKPVDDTTSTNLDNSTFESFVKPKSSLKSKKLKPINDSCTPSDINTSIPVPESLSNGKPKPQTPYLPKNTPTVVKNPMLFGHIGKLNLSECSSTGSNANSSRLTKPDTPSLPFVSKSPNYSYVLNPNVLSRLSRSCAASLSEADEKNTSTIIDSVPDRPDGHEKDQDIIEQSKIIVASTIRQPQTNEETPKRGDSPMEVERQVINFDALENRDDCGEPNELSSNVPNEYFESLADINSVDEVQEGFVIAFKTTELQDNVPVISSYKEARVKSKNGSVLHLEYLNAAAAGREPEMNNDLAEFQIEGYETDSVINPEYLDFSWMISPKFCRTSDPYDEN